MLEYDVMRAQKKKKKKKKKKLNGDSQSKQINIFIYLTELRHDAKMLTIYKAIVKLHNTRVS